VRMPDRIGRHTGPPVVGELLLQIDLAGAEESVEALQEREERCTCPLTTHTPKSAVQTRCHLRQQAPSDFLDRESMRGWDDRMGPVQKLEASRQRSTTYWKMIFEGPQLHTIVGTLADKHFVDLCNETL
jgi:hypothetical protein